MPLELNLGNLQYKNANGTWTGIPAVGGGSGGGVAEFTELFRVTTTEEVKRIETGIDISNYSEIAVLCNNVVASDGTSTGHFEWGLIGEPGSGYGWLINSGIHNTQKRMYTLHGVKIAEQRWMWRSSFSNANDGLFREGSIGVGLASNIYSTDKGQYEAVGLYNSTTNMWFGVYAYNAFNLPVGVEAVVYGR